MPSGVYVRVKLPYIRTPEMIEKYRRGGRYIRTPEYFAKLKPRSVESRLRTSRAMKGKPKSEAGRKNMSIAQKKKFENLEIRLKIAKSLLGKIGPEARNWQGGISCEPYCDAWADEEYKDSIRKRDNHQCQNCGKYQNELDRKLDLHHINYNKKNCHPSNLISLCRSCNAGANRNRDYWQSLYRQQINQKFELKVANFK